jgi:methyl-accepting chemotaxis protein
VLDEIVRNVGKATDLVSEIAAASQEQAQGINQVNTAVAQMDKVTQQNAANAEQSASASEELSAQAESMQEVMGQLIALVGGDSARAKAAQTTRGRRSPRPGDELKLVHPLMEHGPGKEHGFGKSDETFHKIARGNPPARQKAPGKPPAHKVIPLDQPEDDLKEFNG